MIRISTLFIAACMALIAAALGVVAFYVLGLERMQAGAVGGAIFIAMLAYHLIASRLRHRGDVGAQIADLSRGTADLARQVAEFGRRLGALETGAASDSGNIRALTEPLSSEITELGAIVRQLAQSVAAHEEALARPAPMQDAAAPPLFATDEAEPIIETDSAPDHAARAAPNATAPSSAHGPALGLVHGSAGGDDTTHRMSNDSAGARPNGQSDRAADPAADHAAMVARVRDAIEANRLDLYLQPLVTLPQRKVRFYEAMSRLRDDTGTPIAASDFIDIAEGAGLMPRIDHMVIFRCVQVLRRLQVKTKDVGLFCNFSRKTLGDADIFRQCLDFLQANRALAPALVFEFRQAALKNLVPVESEHLARLAELGFRLSIDHVTELRLDPRELSDLGVKFVKVPARMLLEGGAAGLDIHPADLSDLLGRFGIDLVAEKIEGEKSVVDLLDYDVRYGQGFLFAPPRPLRPDNMGGDMPAKAPPKPAAGAAAHSAGHA